MNTRIAIISGLMLSLGLGGAVFAQHGPYRNWAMSRRAYGNERQAEQMVRQAYRDVLRREPDASGLQQYTNNVLYQGWSEADVRRSLLNSTEYAERTGSTRYGRAGNGYPSSGGYYGNNGYYRSNGYGNNGYAYGNGSYGQATSMVRRAYRSVLGREPDEAGLRAYTDKVVREGWSERDLVNALRSSDEYRSRIR